jgi:hypothetical protein
MEKVNGYGPKYIGNRERVGHWNGVAIQGPVNPCHNTNAHDSWYLSFFPTINP